VTVVTRVQAVLLRTKDAVAQRGERSEDGAIMLRVYVRAVVRALRVAGVVVVVVVVGRDVEGEVGVSDCEPCAA